MTNQDPRPDCFGILEIVFPKGEDGLRHSPGTCLDCGEKTDCLRAALSHHQGLEVKSEMLDRAYHSGLVGFWKRWSMKKNLENKKLRSS
ncbi:MAG: hypothetical protein KKF30_15530 [Proteobacteria bacterium]|nr:hypothetical protein [Pseudomonadota bacterium]MBU4469649.1 hypothetical protein [Pseudomonadota bacterium]MCG2751732.1 hypothetical protein [Desulfobacteraceae bacterium]